MARILFLIFLFDFYGAYASEPRPSTSQIFLVEATRLGGETIDPSRSVTIVEEADFRAKSPATVADILRGIPGIETIRQGAVGQTTSVFIRGARSEDTLVLIDGMEANDAMAPASGFDFSALPAGNVARIEVYRGPQSVRFGAGALGGVINIVTKEGDGPARMRASAEGGSYGTRRGTTGVSGKAGALAYSFGLEKFITRGFSAASASDGNTEVDGAEIKAVSSKLVWRPTSSTSLEGVVRAFEGTADLDLQGGVGGDDPNSASRTRQLVAGVRGSTRFLDESLRSTLGMYGAKMERDDFNRPDSVNAQDSFNTFRSESRKIENENEFSLGEAHTLRASLQHRAEAGNSDSGFNGALTSVGRKSQSVSGVALTYLYDDASWFADLGGRTDTSSSAGSIASHRVSLGRTFNEGASKIFLAHGSGFKLPSLFQQYSTYGTEGLHHESSSSLELTGEHRWTPALAVGATLFRAEFRELIDFDFLASKYFNVSRSRSEGAELRATYELRAGLELEASSTYLETRDEATGLPLLRRPRNAWTAAVKYRGEALNFSLSARHRGSRPDVDPNTFARIGAPSYEVVELGAGYAFSPVWKIDGRIENIFDRKYEEVAGYGTSGLAAYAGLSAEL